MFINKILASDNFWFVGVKKFMGALLHVHPEVKNFSRKSDVLNNFGFPCRLRHCNATVTNVFGLCLSGLNSLLSGCFSIITTGSTPTSAVFESFKDTGCFA